MATITFKGNEIGTIGQLPAVGGAAPDFSLWTESLGRASLADFAGRKLVLNIFPSLDTGICAMSVRRFNQLASSMDAQVLNISEDLPFAQKRFCGAEGIENVTNLSAFRSSFAQDWGVEMTSGPLQGLCSRAVVILDENGVVTYTEQVPEIVQEPDYDAAVAALG